MALVRLKIPVLVKNTKVDNQLYYHLRPLFTGHPVASHRRLELAAARLRDEVRQFFKGFTLTRNNADHLLWYLFNPEINYHLFSYEFRSGDLQIKGSFGVASFMLQNITFACLPNVSNFMFIAATGKISKQELRAKVQKVLLRLLLRLKQEQEENFNLEALYSSNREFLTHIDANINVSFGSFQHETSDSDWIFARLREEAEFDGAIEIEKVGYDLNSRYPAELGRAFYQDELTDKIYHIVFQEDNTPLAIIGEEGVGKHALMHEVVWRYQSSHYTKRKGEPEVVWHIDPTRIISGMSIQGMWQKRFEAIISFVRHPLEGIKRADKLLIDNSIALLRIGRSAQNNMTLSDVLKPYLEKRQLQLILIATPEEWKVVQEKDRSFADLFQVIRIQEPPADISARIILEQRKLLERENDCIITIQAIHELFTLQRNFYRNRAMPGSMMRMLRLLATKYRFDRIDAHQVRDEFKTLSGLQERMLDSGEQLNQQTVHDTLAQELVGQPRAVQALENVVHLSKAKLVDHTKPVSSFLFIGPTGVGKTQAAKVLCNYLMGGEEYLLRFDMNEYIDGSAVQRLIGDFYNPEGLFTGKVRYRPFGVLLLDEIEKAHTKVHDLLLQLLDEGRLTDSLGRSVDFSNTVIIMTSNLGAREIALQVGFNPSAESEAAIYRKAVENFFRPEFVNRIDEIVVFNPLELDHILNIARLQIRELLQRDGFVRRTTILNISKDALEWVARRGFDARMGGRALKRQIERDLTTLSAEQLISTHADSPILFDITFENEHLTPRITPLEFLYPLEEDWLPALPDEKHGKTFYGKLLKALEHLEKEITSASGDLDENDGVIVIGASESSGQLNWQYYDFKNKVAEEIFNLRTIMLGFQERYIGEAPALPLRLKRGYLIPPRRAERAFRENFRDRLFQEEGLRELREAYQYSTVQFDTIQTDFINHYLEVAFLLLASRDFWDNRTEQISIQFESLITGLGNWEIQYLMDQYTAFLKSLDIQYITNKEEHILSADGYALYDLLQGEEGIHLFYIAHQNPLPIRVSIQRQGTIQSNNQLYKVIRIYDGSSTLTDLHTGFSNAMNMMPGELKLLVYAGISSDLRRALII